MLLLSPQEEGKRLAPLLELNIYPSAYHHNNVMKKYGESGIKSGGAIWEEDRSLPSGRGERECTPAWKEERVENRSEERREGEKQSSSVSFPLPCQFAVPGHAEQRKILFGGKTQFEDVTRWVTPPSPTPDTTLTYYKGRRRLGELATQMWS